MPSAAGHIDASPDCPSCHCRLLADDQFCAACGARVGAGDTPPPASRPLRCVRQHRGAAESVPCPGGSGRKGVNWQVTSWLQGDSMRRVWNGRKSSRILALARPGIRGIPSWQVTELRAWVGHRAGRASVSDALLTLVRTCEGFVVVRNRLGACPASGRYASEKVSACDDWLTHTQRTMGPLPATLHRRHIDGRPARHVALHADGREPRTG